MIKLFRQNGQRLTITETKFNHQMRQIERRDARNAKRAKELASK